MDFDLRVSELDPFHGRLEKAQERVFELQAGTRVDSDEFFSEEFMRSHTQFDSFHAFYRESPWTLDEWEFHGRTPRTTVSTATSRRRPSSKRGRR